MDIDILNTNMNIIIIHVTVQYSIPERGVTEFCII